MSLIANERMMIMSGKCTIYKKLLVIILAVATIVAFTPFMAGTQKAYAANLVESLNVTNMIETSNSEQGWAWYPSAAAGYGAKTLVLDGFVVQPLNVANVGLTVPDGTTIILKGENLINNNIQGIVSGGSITIQGSGSLAVTSATTAITGSTITINSGTVTAISTATNPSDNAKAFSREPVLSGYSNPQIMTGSKYSDATSKTTTELHDYWAGSQYIKIYPYVAPHITYYMVTGDITNGTLSPTSVVANTEYTGTITPASYASLPQSVTITVGGVELSAADYTYSDGKITIPAGKVTGAIVVTADCSCEAKASGAVVNQQTPGSGEGYKGTITPGSGKTLPLHVTVKSGGVELTEGTDYTYDPLTGTVSIISNKVTGSIEIIAKCPNDTNVNGQAVNSGSIQVVVSKPSSQTATNIVITGTERSEGDGGSISFLLTTKNSVVSGQTINAQIGDKSYTLTTGDDGTATVSNTFAEGTYDVSASYEGNSTYKACSNTKKLNVAKKGELLKTVLTANEFVEKVNEGKYFTGKLTLVDGSPLAGQHIGMKLTNPRTGASKVYWVTTDEKGEYSLQINLAVGNYTADSFYEGNNKYAASEAAQTKITVIAQPTEDKTATVLTANNYSASAVGGFFTGNLATADGTALANQNIVLKITRLSTGASKYYYVTTDEKGNYELEINLGNGKYTVDATYSGTTKYAAATATATITMNRSTIKKASQRMDIAMASAVKSKYGKIQVIKATKKSSKSIAIPKTIKYKGYTYNVTSIAKSAFSKNKSLKTVTIKSKNITKIGKSAFSKCKKGMTFKLPKSKYKTYKKMLIKSGVPSGSKFKTI